VRRVAILVWGLACVWAPSLAQAQAPEPATPELIDRAVDRGTIDDRRANVLRVYALRGDSRLPAAYKSDTPWRGTLLARQIDRDQPAARAALLAIPGDPNITTCDTSAGGTTSLQTAHFYIQYTPGTFGTSGLTINDYAASLEEAWSTEVDTFGWAAPPLDPDTEGKYHVVIDPTIAAESLYGFVSTEGTYTDGPANNPNTTWDEGDAEASCMVLASDYSTFPGTPQQALDATTAHEFNHSLQYGYGALDDDLVIGDDDHIVEGGATWMEDEVQDAADDNYNYLYPDFTDSLGSHDAGDIYAYWLTFRGLTERFGTGTAGGGQQVMRDFWEAVSEFGGQGMLDHLDAALTARGSSLAAAYHDYAIAARLMQPCEGGFFTPFCFEEADGYVSVAGPTSAQRTISSIGGSASGSVEDNYALNWVDLPTGAVYDLTLTKTSSGGQFRATAICDRGTGFTTRFLTDSLSAVVSVTALDYDTRACTQASLVITNQGQTSANPSSSAARPYTVSTRPPVSFNPATPPGTGAGGPGPTPTADTTAPLLSLLSLSRRRFRAFRSGPGISAQRGTRLRYRLSETAIVRIRLQRRNRQGRWVTLRGSAVDRGAKGVNSFRFSGRWRRKRLALGVYRLRLQPQDRAHNAGSVRTTRSLRILRR
jgi:hypothetical protein